MEFLQLRNVSLWNSRTVLHQIFLTFCKGRRKIAVIDILSTFSWLLNCFVKKYFWLGVFARGLLGVSMGAFSSIIPMFSVEMAPIEKRRFFVSLNQTGVVIGQCLFSFLGSSVDYLGLNHICAVITFLQLLLIYFVNETPSISNESLISEGFTETSTSQITSNHKSIYQKKYLDGLFVSIMLLFLQFSGIGGILTNLSDIMSSAGLDFDPNYQTGISICLLEEIAKLKEKSIKIIGYSSDGDTYIGQRNDQNIQIHLVAGSFKSITLDKPIVISEPLHIQKRFKGYLSTKIHDKLSILLFQLKQFDTLTNLKLSMYSLPNALFLAFLSKEVVYAKLWNKVPQLSSKPPKHWNISKIDKNTPRF